MAKLLLNSRDGQAQELYLKPGSNRVGRNGENDIQIEHPSVSGFHCEITCLDNSIFIKDLGSTNGSFIEGRPIQEAGLAHGQRLQLGSVEMIVDAPPASAPVQTAGAQVQMPAAQASARPRLSVHLPPKPTPVFCRSTSQLCR